MNQNIRELKAYELDEVSGGVWWFVVSVAVAGASYVAGYDRGKDAAERDNRN